MKRPFGGGQRFGVWGCGRRCRRALCVFKKSLRDWLYIYQIGKQTEVIKMLLKVLCIIAALSVAVPMALYHALGKKKGKECLLMNIISFFSCIGIGALVTVGGAVSAFAAGADAGAALSVGEGLKFIGAALSTGLSGIGGGLAVANAASAAIGAMSENEKIMGKTLIFVALAEGIALYGLVISILIING